MAGRRNQTGLRQRVISALGDLGLLPKDEERDHPNIRAVQETLRGEKSTIRTRWDSEDAVPQKLLKNIALLKICFGFTTREVRSLISDDRPTGDALQKLVLVRGEEVNFWAKTYSWAAVRYGKMASMLTSGEPLEELDLSQIVPGDGLGWTFESSMPQVPMHFLQAIQKDRSDAAFQAGEPDAICRVAERYAEAGALEVAESLIGQTLEDNPDHAGCWFQKAHLLIRRSETAQRNAARYRFLGEESEALSAAEGHWDMMAGEELGLSHDFRRQAFDACVNAYKRLSDMDVYQNTALKWTSGHGALRQLRLKVLRFIVQHAGMMCDPYKDEWDTVHRRICARLEIKGDNGSKIGPDAVRLSKQPLFDEIADNAIFEAYRELMRTLEPGGEANFLRLQALNFLRFVAPKEYSREVATFVDQLNVAYPEIACAYVGEFDGLQSSLIGPNWRTTMHEHLDTIMSRREQRELVRLLYGKWIENVEAQRDRALSSLFDDEIRIRFSHEDRKGVFEAASTASSEGIYKNEDGHGALVLFCAAKYANGGKASKSQKQSIEAVLGDQELRRLARHQFETVHDDWEAPPPEFLWLVEDKE